MDTSSNGESSERNANPGGDQVTIQELFPQQTGAPDDRLPPQDLHAEQSVLGGMLLSKDAIADCVEVLRPADFYRPQHEAIFDAVLGLYGRGEPADAITVSDELGKRGDLGRVGGQAYLHQLISSVPTAANAGYYAQIVAERAVLRRLVEAGTKIVQLGYAQGGGDVEDIVNAAQAEIYAVVDKRGGEDYHRLSDILEMTVDEIEVASGKSGEMTGVPTGFTDLDSLTNGLHPGQMIVLAARPAIGKALALDTPLATPSGWTSMGDVQVGDYLFGADGQPTRVIAATEVMSSRPCYELVFSDGERIVADAEHQWATTTRASRRAASERGVQPRPPSWAGPDIARLTHVAEVAAREPDRLVSTTELVREVGEVFRHVLRAQVVRQVPTQGREPRPFAKRSTARLSADAVAEIRAAGYEPGLYADLAVRFGVSERTIRRAHTGNHRGAMGQDDDLYLWPTPVYSRQLLLKVLLDWVTRPAVAWNRREHAEVTTTAHIAETLHHVNHGESRLNHAVAVGAPLRMPEATLPLPAYTLGAWLGDGNSHSSGFTCADPEILERIEADGVLVRKTAGPYHYGLRFPQPSPLPARECLACGRSFYPASPAALMCSRRHGPPRVAGSLTSGCVGCDRSGGGRTGLCRECWLARTFQGRLRNLGVLGDKHIPRVYLRASERQRRELLAGLLDTDGYAAKTGVVQFTNTNERLVAGVLELVRSLGYKPTVSTKRVKGRTEATSTCFTVSFTTGETVFNLGRKASRQRPVRPHSQSRVRYITDVNRIPSVPVRCVEVDNDDHLYLAGRSMIPTHNSTLGLDIVRTAAIRHNLASVIFSLEMSKTEITMRLLSAEAGIQLQHMRKGTMREEDWTRLASTMGRVSEAPLFIDDSPNMSLMEIRAKCRRLKQRDNLKLVVIDYLQLMSSGKKVESRQQEVSEFSRALKLLAKELEVPVVAISQLNRGPEQRTDKRPQMSDLRESGSIEQDADMVILLHREEAYERESPRAGEADLIVAKHRNGPTDTIVLAFQGHYSRFTNMAPSF